MHGERETENWLSNTYADTELFQTNTGFNLLTQTWQKKVNDSIIQKNYILGVFLLLLFYKMKGLEENCNSTLTEIGLIRRYMRQ